MLPSYEFEELRLELVFGEVKRARNVEQRGQNVTGRHKLSQ